MGSPASYATSDYVAEFPRARARYAEELSVPLFLKRQASWRTLFIGSFLLHSRCNILYTVVTQARIPNDQLSLVGLISIDTAQKGLFRFLDFRFVMVTNSVVV